MNQYKISMVCRNRQR